MGLIAKQRTKSRTASARYITSLSTDWIAEGMPQMATIVRAAASSVARRDRLRSSGFRGHDTLGIGSALRSGDSTVWMEQVGFDVWAIGLGLSTVRGRALDWQLKLQTSRIADAVHVTLSTPTVLTTDGAQVHKDEYLEAREIVVAGLAASSSPRGDGELLAGTRGLDVPPPPFASAPIVDDGATFLITTRLSRDAILDRLAQLHFQSLPTDNSDGKWRVGLRAAEVSSSVDLAIGESNMSRELKFTVHVADRQHAIATRVLTRHVTRFATCALAQIKSCDKNAVMTGEEVLLDAAA